MNSIVLCEGSTDYFLLQYYMREAYNWQDDKNIQAGILKMSRKEKSRNFIKDSNILTIMSTGGCSQLCNGLELALNRNFLSPPNLSDVYEKIVIVTDRDEIGTEQTFIQSVEQSLKKYNVTYTEQLSNNSWLACQMYNQLGIVENISLLVMIIPFEDNGAMETFLLNAIRKNNSYDEQIIDKCNKFVDCIDPNKKYLSSPRYVTKAKFNTYFSIRLPVENFTERQDIVKKVQWEKYTKIQKDFEKLGEI